MLGHDCEAANDLKVVGCHFSEQTSVDRSASACLLGSSWTHIFDTVSEGFSG